MAVKKEKTYKLDLYKDVIPSIRSRNINYYSKLSEEKKKSFSFFVLMRNILGSNSGVHIVLLNEYINPVLFDWQKSHSELLYRLFVICMPPLKYRLKFVKVFSRKNSKTLSVIKEYFNYNTRHALDTLNILSNDQIIKMAEDLGKQKQEITDLKKELKNR